MRIPRHYGTVEAFAIEVEVNGTYEVQEIHPTRRAAENDLRWRSPNRIVPVTIAVTPSKDSR